MEPGQREALADFQGSEAELKYAFDNLVKHVQHTPDATAAVKRMNNALGRWQDKFYQALPKEKHGRG